MAKEGGEERECVCVREQMAREGGEESEATC